MMNDFLEGWITKVKGYFYFLLYCTFPSVSNIELASRLSNIELASRFVYLFPCLLQKYFGFLIRHSLGQLLKKTWPLPEGSRFCSYVWVRDLKYIFCDFSRRAVHVGENQDDSSGSIGNEYKDRTMALRMV